MLPWALLGGPLLVLSTGPITKLASAEAYGKLPDKKGKVSAPEVGVLFKKTKLLPNRSPTLTVNHNTHGGISYSVYNRGKGGLLYEGSCVAHFALFCRLCLE